MAVLRKLFGQNIPDPIDILVPKLHSDPLFHGAYSAWPVGYAYCQKLHTDFLILKTT